MTDATTLGLLVATIATFLIGVNAALVYRFWPEGWLTVKCFAVSGLLLYISLSVLYGTPATWRVAIGLASVLIDTVAVFAIWRALHKASEGDGILIAYQRR